MKNLTYPVNVLRNVARQNAPTHYILASDAELYPSPNLVQEFFDMLRRNDTVLHLNRPKVFVLPIFEVYSNQTVPTSKSELVRHIILLDFFLKINLLLQITKVKIVPAIHFSFARKSFAVNLLFQSFIMLTWFVFNSYRNHCVI